MIYFDNAATTRVTPEAAQTVFKYLTEKYYNPSAMYHEALDVKNDLENARSVILNLIGGEGDALLGKGGRHIRTELAGHLMAVRVGTDEQGPGGGGQSLPDPVYKAVCIAQDCPVGSFHKGAAGNEQGHKNASLNPRVREIFLDKINSFDLEGLPVQVFQGAGISGEAEGQFVRVQSLIIPVIPLVQLPVFAVSQQGMSGMGELSPDLVSTAGNQFAFHQAQTIPGGQGDVVGLAGLGSGLGGVGDEHPVLFGILE